MTVEPQKRKRVLVVDDEPDVCIYLSKLLEEHGYETACAGDGAEAMARVEADKPDLITLDLSMPNKSGVRFYQEIRSRSGFDTIPVILVTGVTGMGDSGATKRFYSTRRQVPPPDGFLAKPIDPDEMLGLIRKLI